MKSKARAILIIALSMIGVTLLIFPDVCLTKGVGYTPPPDPDMFTTCTPSGGVYWYIGAFLIILAMLIGSYRTPEEFERI
ncbi:MAG: hypothetical protein ACW99U_20790 [Candidatus Thorarchaeota archaeon]|jgi:hypothetical protein